MGPPLLRVLMCLLLHWSCAAYLQFPANSTTCLGATTELDCASTDAQTIFYYVNNTPAVSLSAQGITVSAPISNGSVTHVKLYVAGTSVASVSQILCTILFTNGSFLNSTSYLTTQGPPSAVANLVATPFNATFIRLAWSPLTNAQPLSALTYMYIVEVRNGRGALLYNVTVTVPQLDIAIPDPCDQYQATVTAVCGTTSGANSISLKFFVAPPSPPNNLTTTALNTTSTNLSWMPPYGFQYSSLLLYVVEVRNFNGTLVFNEIVSMPQALVTTLSSCGQYQAAIAAKCKTGANTTFANYTFEQNCGIPGNVISSSATMIQGIIGGTIGGSIACIIILLIFVILSYICVLKRKQVQGQSEHSDGPSEVHVQSMNKLKTSEIVSKDKEDHKSDKIKLKDEYVYTDSDHIGTKSSTSSVVIKVKKKNNLGDERFYAIKIIPEHAFRHEIKVLSTLDEETFGIVRYKDTWEELAPPNWRSRFPWNKFAESTQVVKFVYIQMDYCDSGNLYEWLSKNKESSNINVIRIFDKLLETMISIHEQHVYHNDLSLNNIFVTKKKIERNVDDYDFKIGGFTKAIHENKGDAEVAKEVACKHDILSLGYILIQLVYVVSHKEDEVPECLESDRISVLLELSSKPQLNPILELFNKLGKTVDQKSVPVMKLLCGEKFCGDGIRHLRDLRRSSEEYKKWQGSEV